MEVDLACPSCAHCIMTGKKEAFIHKMGAVETCEKCGKQFEALTKHLQKHLDPEKRKKVMEIKAKAKAMVAEEKLASKSKPSQKSIQIDSNPAAVIESAKPESKPATKKCPYCAEEILSEAIKCKHCSEILTEQAPEDDNNFPIENERKNKNIIPTIICLIFLVFWAITIFSNGNNKTPKPKDKVSALFSAWDGSNREMVSAAKRHMKAPSSFEHIETRYSDRGNKVVITMKFKGKNSFNATVQSTAIGVINPETRTLIEFSIYK